MHLRAYVSQHPEWDRREHIYRDDGSSGTVLNRPGLDQVRDQAAQGAFSHVLITTPDRLTRNSVYQAVRFEELAKYGGQGS